MRGPSSRPRRPTRLTAVHAPEGDGTDTPDTVLVVDFRAQYAQLIARRVRECQVYSELVPASMPVAQMLARQRTDIILSGAPPLGLRPGSPPRPGRDVPGGRAHPRDLLRLPADGVWARRHGAA